MRKIVFFCSVFLLLFITTANASNAVEIKNNDELLLDLGYDQSDINNFTKTNTIVLVTSHNNEITGKELKKYAQLGYSEKEIIDFGNNEISYLNNLEGELISVDKKYMEDDTNGMVEITKEEYDQNVQEYLAIMAICNLSSQTCSDTKPTTNWIVLTTSISKISNTTPQEYIIKHDFTWTKKPFYTFKDAIGVGNHVSMSPVQNSEYLKYSADRYYSNNPINGLGPWNADGIADNWIYTANTQSGGIGFEFQLYSDWQLSTGKQYKYENHRGTMAYRVIRNNSSFTAANFSGHYIHTEQSFSGSLGVSFPAAGAFSISANITKTPAIETGITFNY
ncbi:hypothetical protein ABEW34_10495 [Paenibacillus algorifonticola]|uniref:hypothetical protein n=1 Tax=Paenibacillus algorifonticola TaxID=684063 RepID=UPI003D2817DE